MEISVNLDQLDVLIAEGKRPADAREKVLAAAVSVTDSHARVPMDDWRRITGKTRSTPSPAIRPAPDPTVIQPRKPTPKGPGSHLKDIIAERFGSLPGQGCGCSSMVAKMDKWGIDGCIEHRDEIIAHLMGQTDQLPKGKRWALKLPGGKYVARKVAGSMVDAAVGRAELDTLRSNRPGPPDSWGRRVFRASPSMAS